MHTSGGADAAAPTGIVLVLHGGRVNSTDPVRPWNLALARMRLFVAPVLEHAAPAGVAVAVLRYRHRGWNQEAADAHADAEWALGELSRRYGPVPVALIGHSMGGRAALRAGGHPSVTGIAALAPWAPDGEPVEQLAGQPVAVSDRWPDNDVLTWRFAGGRVVLRPSGTEPKCKAYLELVWPPGVTVASDEVTRELDSLAAEVTRALGLAER